MLRKESDAVPEGNDPVLYSNKDHLQQATSWALLGRGDEFNES